MRTMRATALIAVLCGPLVAQEPVWRNTPDAPVVTRPASQSTAPPATPVTIPVVSLPAAPSGTPWVGSGTQPSAWQPAKAIEVVQEAPKALPPVVKEAPAKKPEPVAAPVKSPPKEEPSQVLPAPKPVTPKEPVPEVKVPVLLTPPPTQTVPNAVWGSSPSVATTGAELEPWPGMPTVIPERRGVVGSPNLTLSRDFSFLDIFGMGLLGENSEDVIPGQVAPSDRAFVQAEYLLWWMQAANVPVLATTAVGQSSGYLGMPGTQVLLGPGTFGSTARNGFRVRAGAWLDECAQTGVDASYFFLGQQSTNFQIDSNQFPTIARPFFAPNLGREFGELVAFPGLSTGALRVETSSSLWGADINYRCGICNTCDSRSEAFIGYRHLNLRENLTVTEFITSGPNAPDPAGTSIVVSDSFTTRNRFHGGQVGYAFARRRGNLEVSGRISVALGVNSQELETTGTQRRVQPGQGAELFTGGLLAAGPNLGTFHRDRFSVAPEATLNVGFWINERLKASVGYNFLFWSNVIRPGDQIDRTVDLTFVPNAPRVPFNVNRPLPTFDQSNVWVQGISFGLEYRW
jgi:hypothetical protein